MWKSDNPLVVSVDAKGKLTALKAGTANITCDDVNGGAVSAPVLSRLLISSLPPMLAKDLGECVNLGRDIGGWYFMDWLGTAGAQIYPDGDTSVNTMNSPETAAMIKWMIPQSRSGKLCYRDMNTAAAQLSDGTLGAYIDGPWSRNTLAEAIGWENLGVAELPYVTVPDCVNNKHMVCFNNTKVYVLSAHSKHPEAALSLAQYIAAPEMLAQLYNMNQELIPLLATEENASDSLVMSVIEQSEYFVPYTNTDLFTNSQYWDICYQLMRQILNNMLEEDSVQDVLDECVAQMNSNLSFYS